MTLGEQFAAAQAWWRDAGVDQDFMDEVQVMLAEDEEVAPKKAPAAAATKAAEPEPVPPKLATADLPDSLAAFQDWWASDENPFSAGNQQAVAPRGTPEATAMVLAPMPEADDAEVLLSGPQGRFVSSVFHAVGVDPADVYFASALPGHMPLPDWERLGKEGLGLALAHHITLVKPTKLIVFGSKLPTLFGHDQAAPPEAFSQLAEASVLTTFAPDRLLDHARQRARLWKRLLEWTHTP